MRLEGLISERFKERPGDCIMDSHALLVRGGYIKSSAVGMYNKYPAYRKVMRKLENLVNEVMDSYNMQEVDMTSLTPLKVTPESKLFDLRANGRFIVTDRNSEKYFVQNEKIHLATEFIKEFGSTYSRYPFYMYDICDILADEERPRNGLIKSRQSHVIEGFSFHKDKEDMEKGSMRIMESFKKIADKLGLKNAIDAKTDDGSMRGALSTGLFSYNELGFEKIVSGKETNFRADLKVAPTVVKNEQKKESEELKKVFTPNCHTIEDLSKFLNMTEEESLKAVVYQKETDNRFVVLFLRGDYDVNETKLKNIVGCEIYPGMIDIESGIVAGFIGPYNFKADADVYFDITLKDANNLTCGANEEDYHITGLDIKRDLGDITFIDASLIKEDSLDPTDEKSEMEIKDAFKIGQVTEEGTAVAEYHGMSYLDEKGVKITPWINSFRLNLDILMSLLIEENHDDWGPRWPEVVAPWEVHVCAMRASEDDTVRNIMEDILKRLKEEGIDFIYDDRSVSPGFMFSDADLIGVPYRMIISPRNLKENVVEIVTRDKSIQEKVPIESAFTRLMELLKENKS